jgi:hypothetical protein
MISLDGVDLSDSMIWRERYNASGVEQTEDRTLGGVPVVFSEGYEKGVPITLAAETDIGWLTRTQVLAMLERAAVPGAVYALDFGSETFDVIFTGDRVRMEPVYARVADAASDYFRGELFFMTV